VAIGTGSGRACPPDLLLYLGGGHKTDNGFIEKGREPSGWRFQDSNSKDKSYERRSEKSLEEKIIPEKGSQQADQTQGAIWGKGIGGGGGAGEKKADAIFMVEVKRIKKCIERHLRMQFFKNTWDE